MKFFKNMFNKKKKSPLQDHTELAWFICLPCILITGFSLRLADISPYLISFIIVVLALLCSFVIFTSKQRSEQQIRTLSNILESMIAGDYSLRGRLQSNQAFQELLLLVNSLAETLDQHKIEAKESRQLLEKILEQMDAMVMAVNDQGYLVMANNSAKKLLLKSNQPIEKVQLATHDLGKIITQANTDIIDFKDPHLRGEHFLFKESFLSDGKTHQLYLITSAERLLLEKERKSWQSLLRVLSHEMNNSLTPIASISQSMKQKLQNETKDLNRSGLLEGVNIVNERASSLSSFIASYSQLSHLPLPNKSVFIVNDILLKTSKLFDSKTVKFAIEQQSLAGVSLSADKSQFEQVLINLFKNAQEAMHESNHKLINITAYQNEKYFNLVISDNGSGIANEENLFVPFYSTKPQGSGIGLTLCRQIMFNHGGLITLRNRQGIHQDNQGVDAVISLPLNSIENK